jgi:hypothetical protein
MTKKATTAARTNNPKISFLIYSNFIFINELIWQIRYLSIANSIMIKTVFDPQGTYYFKINKICD